MIKKILFPLMLIFVMGIFLFATENVNSQTEPIDEDALRQNARIVGGTVASTGEYPWQVALVSSGFSNAFFRPILWW